MAAFNSIDEITLLSPHKYLNRAAYHCYFSEERTTHCSSKMRLRTKGQPCVAGCRNIRTWATRPVSTFQRRCCQTLSTLSYWAESTLDTAGVCRHCDDPVTQLLSFTMPGGRRT